MMQNVESVEVPAHPAKRWLDLNDAIDSEMKRIKVIQSVVDLMHKDMATVELELQKLLGMHTQKEFITTGPTVLIVSQLTGITVLTPEQV